MTDTPFHILVVCTANICRSVMAETMLRAIAEERELPLTVSSCGMLFDGEPASERVLAVLDERELDAHEHRSRKFTPAMMDDVDLAVTMERGHARELALQLEGASPRIHTLGAIVPWLEEARLEEARLATAQPRDRVAAFAEGRRPSDLLGSGREEIADPHGRSKRVHRKTADRLDDLTKRLVDGLFGPAE